MSYGLNFGFTTMPMMNYTMPMGSGIQSDNWQYSYFAGPGKSSISYPVDQMSVMNDMALKNYVDNTYNLVPQMMNFMNQMQAKFQQWYNQMQMEMKKRMEIEKDKHSVCLYSLRNAETGSLFAALLEGIIPPIKVKTTLSTTKMTPPATGKEALTSTLPAIE